MGRGRESAGGKLVRGEAGDFKVRTGFRLHLGGEDQQVDPLIASIETIDRTPAYRGIAMAVFERLELADFGNRIPVLTFEVEADELPPRVGDVLADASAGAVLAEDDFPIAGFAAHGASIGDAVAALVELCGLDLAERDGALRSGGDESAIMVSEEELGCASGNEPAGRIERERAADSALPASIAMTYYDPARDYQAGQAQASSGRGGTRNERIELAAALGSEQAKGLVEQALARRWRSGDRTRLSLPPARMNLRPGARLLLPGSGESVTIQSIQVDGLAVQVEARRSGEAALPLPADPGRALAEADVELGRSTLVLFELPALGNAPSDEVVVHLAAACSGSWKAIPVEMALAACPLPGIPVRRRSVAGHAQDLLPPGTSLLLDRISSVTVRLSHPADCLFNADDDALMGGANLAILGEELIQFGIAEELEPGLYRLSNLLRGRRGTEWATAVHAVGDGFCLVEPSVLRSVRLAPAAVGAPLAVTAHGIADVAPLPTAVRALTGEALRPPSPCHFAVRAENNKLRAEWTRRSHAGWSWMDEIEVPPDAFPERYRLTLTGPGGQFSIETGERSVLCDLSAIPAAPGQTITASVVALGSLAISREAAAILIL